jgi:putative transposase
VACRVRNLSRSGYYEWRDRPPAHREVEGAHLANTIVDIHTMSRCSYGTPRVHADLRLGMGVHVGRKRVVRLLRLVGRRGISHRHKRRRRPAEAVHEDTVQRKFVADGPDRLWCTDITEHPHAGREGLLLRGRGRLHPPDRRLVDRGPHALRPSSTLRRWPPGDAAQRAPWCISTRGSQYTSWVIGHRLRNAGLLGSMGRVASSVDNSMIESF